MCWTFSVRPVGPEHACAAHQLPCMCRSTSNCHTLTLLSHLDTPCWSFDLSVCMSVNLFRKGHARAPACFRVCAMGVSCGPCPPSTRTSLTSLPLPLACAHLHVCPHACPPCFQARTCSCPSPPPCTSLGRWQPTTRCSLTWGQGTTLR